MNEPRQWGFLRETRAMAQRAGIDQDTGLPRTGLEEYLEVIYPNEEWIHNRTFGHNMLIRPDYRNDKLKIVIEFDGLQHYQSPQQINTDREHTLCYQSYGYQVIRIPYFIQLTNSAIKTLFGVDVKQPMFDPTVPSMGLKGKNTPRHLKCPEGVMRMAKEFLRFPEQYEVNVRALKLMEEQFHRSTGVDLLEEAMARILQQTSL